MMSPMTVVRMAPRTPETSLALVTLTVGTDGTNTVAVGLTACEWRALLKSLPADPLGCVVVVVDPSLSEYQVRVHTAVHSCLMPRMALEALVVTSPVVGARVEGGPHDQS